MDCLQKKRKRINSPKSSNNLLQNNIKKINIINYNKEESYKLNPENNNFNIDKVNNDNPKFTHFYHSSNEKILYFSNILNSPKYFHSSFDNLPFHCSYNSFKNNREYNEDKILISCQENSEIKLHLFSIFDGHNGDKCCKFLSNNFDKILFSNKNILQKPSRALKETYIDCENKFMILNKPKNLLTPIEKSGSCALSLLAIGKKIY